ncbi:FAD/NAD-P-binding domain-containing protein [Artomyces pyxidatus]|uniref:FAD/NAD-P-binding domain-containing protein n=1 Tax=Artomyces pyxidatus TaxID=48021 RepID=A0ACB8TAC8_9AGAM|nr:FAD/NAD-P-binding domain-containing protein [Artomyces pyxidatus]
MRHRPLPSSPLSLPIHNNEQRRHPPTGPPAGLFPPSQPTQRPPLIARIQAIRVPATKQASAPILFLVIGGGIAGLACAVALRRVGHRVLVIEKDADFDDSDSTRGIRMPPNMTKIFNYWGMHDQLQKIGVISERVVMSRLENAWTLGTHRWDTEMLQEAGGEFIFLYHSQLRKLLLETAEDLGAQVRTGCEAMSVSDDCRSVRLKSGEVLHADVIVGADGSHGLCRRLLLKGEPDTAKSTDLMMLNAVVPGEVIKADPDLIPFLKQDLLTQWVWFGHRHASLFFPIVSLTRDCAFYFYGPDDEAAREGWGDVLSSEQVTPYFDTAEPRLRKIATLASPSRIRVTERVLLEDWVHDSGRLLVVGEAAHPFPPGAIQASSMSLEDASVLAKLFSHLREEEQIPSFLYAFQNLRHDRCQKNRVLDMANIYFMTMPDGEQAGMRDKMMRAKHDSGRDVLGGDDGDGNVAQWDENRELFGYDAEDEADNWWVQWGLLRERSKASNVGALDIFSLDIAVQKSHSS